MHILDHEENLDGQGSMEARNYRTEWKLNYPWIRAIDVLGQTRLKCIFCEKHICKRHWNLTRLKSFSP